MSLYYLVKCKRQKTS